MLFTMLTQNKKHYVVVLDNGEPDSNKIRISMEELFIFFQEKKDMRLYNYF